MRNLFWLFLAFSACTPYPRAVATSPKQGAVPAQSQPSIAPGDSYSVTYRIGNPPEEAMYGRDVLTTRYMGSGSRERLNVPAYYHWLQVYRDGRMTGGGIVITSPDSSLAISTIMPAATGDVAGWPWLWVKATRGTKWIIRLAR